MIRFSSFSIALKPHFISKNYELVLSPYEATEILLWAIRAQIIVGTTGPNKQNNQCSQTDRWCFNETDNDENRIVGWHRRYARFDVFRFLIQVS